MKDEAFYSLGLIGCGAVAFEYHIPAINFLKTASNNIEVVCCIDTDINKAKSAAFALNAITFTTSLSDLKNYNSIAVLIAAPPPSHFTLIESSIDLCENIFVEKPLVTSTEQFNKISKLASARNKRLFVGHMRRLYPAINSAKSIIEKGILGPFLKAQIYEGLPFRWNVTSDYLSQAAGGVLFDTASHSFDTFFYLLGIDQLENSILKFSIENSYVDDIEIENAAWGRFCMHLNNFKVDIEYGFDRILPLSNCIRLYFEKGILEIKPQFEEPTSLKLGNSSYQFLNNNHTSPKTLNECFAQQIHNLININLDFRTACQNYSRFYNTTFLLDQLNIQKKENSPPWRKNYA